MIILESSEGGGRICLGGAKFDSPPPLPLVAPRGGFVQIIFPPLLEFKGSKGGEGVILKSEETTTLFSPWLILQ